MPPEDAAESKRGWLDFFARIAREEAVRGEDDDEEEIASEEAA